jgi:hypothetical protein
MGMLNLEIKSKRSPEEVAAKLKKFFGAGGLGLEGIEETPLCYTFTGGGGYVNATLCFEEGKTRINLVTQEWELQVRDFASKMK